MRYIVEHMWWDVIGATIAFWSTLAGIVCSRRMWLKLALIPVLFMVIVFGLFSMAHHRSVDMTVEDAIRHGNRMYGTATPGGR